MLFVVAASTFFMPACIIPVAPEFQDPPAAQNYPPYIVSSDPPIGSIKSATADGFTFQVSVTDPNVGDDLFVRWIADYPGGGAATRTLGDPNTVIPHSADGTPLNAPSRVDVKCDVFRLDPSLTQHRIAFVVGDHPLDGTNLTASQDGVSATTTGYWFLNLACRAQP